MDPTTLNELFFSAISDESRHVVMRHKVDGAWQDIHRTGLLARIRQTHAALRELGFAAGDRVAILSENRPEWAIVDYACLTARLVDVSIYPSLPANQIAYILKDSGSRGVFVSNRAQLEKVLAVRAELPGLQHLICFDPEPGPLPHGVLSLADLEARGMAAVARFPDWEADARAAHPDDLATLIYTSGTTGDPKGVMLTHGNITSNVNAALQLLTIGTTDACLSFLPLCHIFERMVGHFTMFRAGAVINYATNGDTVAAEMREVHPTLLASVPRLYEKIYARVLQGATGHGGVKRAVFEWARATGEKRLEYVLSRRHVPILLAVGKWIADMLVFRTIRGLMGGRIRFMVSGGAPLGLDICRFFLSAGLPILEGYGLTETSPVISVNTFAMLKPGTVGRPIPGVEVKIAPDGEILTRGPHVMRGYYNKPEATAQAIDPEGWFHTGDIGLIDNDGCLRITDRKKDLIVTAGGKNIAPQPIEGMLKTNKFFTNAVMLGDKRKFPIMILVPNFYTLGTYLAFKKLPAGSPEELVAMPAVREKIEREARKSLRDLAQFETPKKFLILSRDFSIDAGELTPTLKVKRRVVEDHYREMIEALYTETD